MKKWQIAILVALAVMWLVLFFSGCTRVKVELPDGTIGSYTYFLQEKTLVFETVEPNGIVSKLRFGSVSDPAVEIMKEAGALMAAGAAGGM